MNFLINCLVQAGRHLAVAAARLQHLVQRVENFTDARSVLTRFSRRSKRQASQACSARRRRSLPARDRVTNHRLDAIVQVSLSHGTKSTPEQRRSRAGVPRPSSRQHLEHHDAKAEYVAFVGELQGIVILWIEVPVRARDKGLRLHESHQRL